MTDSMLNNLSREELLGLALAQQKQIEALQQQLMQQTAADEAGSIAQAALQLSGVFEKAQQAADVYLENVAAMKLRRETEDAALLAQTEAQCRNMVAQARESAAYYWAALQQKIDEALASHSSLLPPQPTAPESQEDGFGPDD